MSTSRHTARITATGDLASTERRARRQTAISKIAREAAQLTCVYEAEWFISSLLGELWEGRGSAPPIEGVDRDLVIAGALVDGLAEHGGAGARLALHTIGRLAPGELGLRGAELAAAVPAPLAPWTKDIGRSRATAATHAGSPGDGTALVIEVQGVGMVDHAIAVFIDARQHHIAKQLGLIHGRRQRAADGIDTDDLATVPLDLRDACRQVLDAVAATDARPRARVGETFSTLRTLALARAASALPAAVPAPWLN